VGAIYRVAREGQMVLSSYLVFLALRGCAARDRLNAPATMFAVSRIAADDDGDVLRRMRLPANLGK
jgi:hypothetical protein